LPFPALLLASLLSIGCGQSPPASVHVTESFDGNSYDHAQWQLATPNEAVGKVEVVDDALVITAPPADKSRPQIGNHGKFSFVGDFEISMDFELLTPLPDATQDYINLELIVTGTDGIAHLSRANHKGSGHGIVAYFKPSSESGKSVWKHLSTTEKSGTLKLIRRQDQLAFLFQAADASEPEPVATASFGQGAIHKVSVALSVSSPTKEALKVRVDNLRVKSGSEDGSLLVSVIVWLTPAIFLILGGITFWFWKSGKRNQPATPVTNQPQS
jgi:hypothetical protein